MVTEMHNGNSEENIKVNKPENKSLMKHKWRRKYKHIFLLKKWKISQRKKERITFAKHIQGI